RALVRSPPFPPRRSSDLLCDLSSRRFRLGGREERVDMELAGCFVIGEIAAGLLGVLDEESGVGVQDVAGAAEDEESPDSIRVGRSEKGTSDPQSRVDLVC